MHVHMHKGEVKELIIPSDARLHSFKSLKFDVPAMGAAREYSITST